MKWFVIGFIIFTLIFPFIGLGILALGVVGWVIVKLVGLWDRICDDAFESL